MGIHMSNAIMTASHAIKLGYMMMIYTAVEHYDHITGHHGPIHVFSHLEFVGGNNLHK